MEIILFKQTSFGLTHMQKLPPEADDKTVNGEEFAVRKEPGLDTHNGPSTSLV